MKAHSFFGEKVSFSQKLNQLKSSKSSESNLRKSIFAGIQTNVPYVPSLATPVDTKYFRKLRDSSSFEISKEISIENSESQDTDNVFKGFESISITYTAGQ